MYESSKAQYGNQIKAQAITQAGGQLGGAQIGASYPEQPLRDKSNADQAMDRLRANLQEMAACVQMMEQSLRTVMTPEDASKEACYGQTPQALSCELVHNINDASAQVAYQVKALRRQLDRLEI